MKDDRPIDKKVELTDKIQLQTQIASAHYQNCLSDADRENLKKIAEFQRAITGF